MTLERDLEILNNKYLEVDPGLRPKQLSEYVGQRAVREKMQLFIEAAKQRGDALDHVLLSGPPGLGKTTLAHIIAHELGSHLHTVAGPNIEKKGDLAAILTNLAPKDVLFIDEIHRLQKSIEEVLYSAMEDYRLDIIIGQGPAAKTIMIEIPRFTLVGATTRSGLLSNPLRDRFGVQLRLDFYPADELLEILKRTARLLSLSADETGLMEVARRSRGTPRIANRLLKRVRDFLQVNQAASLTPRLAADALGLLEIDSLGLDVMDRRLLLSVIERFDGGPVGIESLAALLGESRETLEEIYEPYLIQNGLLIRTPRGRVAGKAAYQHLGIPENLKQISFEDTTPSV